jgi:hypothetical protein
MKKDINLKDKKFKRNKSQRPLTSIFVVVVVVIIFSFFFVMNLLLKKQISGVEMEIKKIEDSLKSEEFQNAYSFGADLIELENLTKNDEFLPITSEIIKISENTLPTITFSKLEINREEAPTNVEAELFFYDYEDLIKQIKLYKETEGINNFNIGEINKKEGNDGFNSSINFILKRMNSEEENDLQDPSK